GVVAQLLDDAADAGKLGRGVVDDEDAGHGIPPEREERLYRQGRRLQAGRGAPSYGSVTSVLPSERPDSIASNTSGRPSSVTSRVQMRSRCRGFQSEASRRQTSSRWRAGVSVE